MELNKNEKGELDFSANTKTSQVDNKQELIDEQAKLTGELVRGKISLNDFQIKWQSLERKFHIYDMMPNIKSV